MMGTQLLHESWKAGVGKFVAIGTVCAYPNPSLRQAQYKRQAQDKVCSYTLQGGRPVERLSRGDQRPLRAGQEDDWFDRLTTGLVQSQTYRGQYGFNSIFLLPVNLYGPRDNPSTGSGQASTWRPPT